MPRTVAYHKIPTTSRVAVTLKASELKELRKLSIDLEISEHDVLRFAVLHMIHRYHEDDLEALASDAERLLADGNQLAEEVK